MVHSIDFMYAQSAWLVWMTLKAAYLSMVCSLSGLPKLKTILFIVMLFVLHFPDNVIIMASRLAETQFHYMRIHYLVFAGCTEN